MDVNGSPFIQKRIESYYALLDEAALCAFVGLVAACEGGFFTPPCACVALPMGRRGVSQVRGLD